MPNERPEHSYTLDQFNGKALELYEQDDHTQFVQFVLNGIYNGEQAVLDPVQNAVLDARALSALRDYDSLIGISSNIDVNRSIWVYPIANPRDTLRESIHLSYNSTAGRDVPAPVLIHRIPNLMFAKWDERNMIRVVFPGLATPERDRVTLTLEEQAEFYQKGLRPAIEEIAHIEASEWPSTFNTEMIRARRAGGQLSYQTKQIPSWSVFSFGRAIRRHLDSNSVLWAEGFFFLLNVRGTKHGTSHAMHESSASNALDDFLAEMCLSRQVLEHGDWYIDVGLEVFHDSSISDDGFGAEEGEFCLQWRTDSHVHVVQQVLDIDLQKASRITSLGSSYYSRDLSSHLTAVSGCRIKVGVQSQGTFKACYMQVYTTDKALTYNPEGTYHGKAFTCINAMTANNSFCDNLYDVYTKAIDTNSSHARIEVRVPFNQAVKVLLKYDEELLCNSLVKFSRESWWGLRAYRLLAISHVLKMQRQSLSWKRVAPQALILTAACVWLANGLHSRPHDDSSSRSLMNATFPCIEAAGADRALLAYPAPCNPANNDSGLHPAIPFGIIFLNKVYMPPLVSAPRIRNGAQLSEMAFHHLFGMSPSAIKHKFSTVGISKQSDRQPDRVSNKAQRTPVYHNWAAAGEPEADLFTFADKGYALPPPDVDEGSDREEVAHNQDPAELLDAKISRLWRQFLQDLFFKCPNPKSKTNESYCKLTRGQRTTVTEAVFCSRRLSDYFYACSYKEGFEKDFGIAFKHFWPEKGHVLDADSQGYRQCAYYKEWKDVVNGLEETVVKAIRVGLRKRFNSLYWVPHACQDKIWPTACHKDFMRLPSGSSGAAPRILVKGVPIFESTSA